MDEWADMQIESYFPGRIRVSSRILSSPENMAKLRERLEGREGVRELSANPRTGSITLVYDPSVITLDMLLEAKKEMEKLEQA